MYYVEHFKELSHFILFSDYLNGRKSMMSTYDNDIPYFCNGPIFSEFPVFNE